MAMKKPFRPVTPFTLGAFAFGVLVMIAAVSILKRYDTAKHVGGVAAGCLFAAYLWSLFRPGARVIIQGPGEVLLKHEDGPATAFMVPGEYTADGINTAMGSYKVRNGATVYVDSQGNVSGVGLFDSMAIETLTDWRPLLSQRPTGW